MDYYSFPIKWKLLVDTMYKAGVAGSNPARAACNFFHRRSGKSTEHSVLITSRKGKPYFSDILLDAIIIR